MIALTHILVATDFGEAADAALVYGRALATGSGASLDVLHVVDNPFLYATVADPLRQLNRRLTDEDHGQRRRTGRQDRVLPGSVSTAPRAEICRVRFSTWRSP